MDGYDQLILTYDRNMYTKDPYNFGASRFFRDLFGYDDSDCVEPIKQTLEYYDKLPDLNYFFTVSAPNLILAGDICYYNHPNFIIFFKT